MFYANTHITDPEQQPGFSVTKYGGQIEWGDGVERRVLVSMLSPTYLRQMAAGLMDLADEVEHHEAVTQA